jgi:ribosomal protein L11 methyltransferase
MTYSVTVTCLESEQDTLIAVFWELGTTGVTQDRDWVRAFFDSEITAPETVLSHLTNFDARVEALRDEENWEAEWKRPWRPLPVGKRLYLAPPWDHEPPPEGRIRVNLRPGMACGSGLHPCTRLCLQLLEVRVRPDTAVLDVGTGSGILAEAALRLGAWRVAACDIDPAATPIARQNLGGSGLTGLCFTGSLRSVRTGMFPIIVANLNAVALGMMAADLRRVCSRVLILSGFREDEVAAVVAKLDLPVQAQAELEGWGAVILACR